MAKAAASGSLVLCLFILLICLGSSLQANTHILSCNFIVKTHSALREPLSDEQCSVDGVPLPPYDNDNKRKKGNAPNECADLFPKLKDIGEELRKQLLTMEEEGDLTRGDHSLHVTMVSLYKEGQPIDPYWNFTNDPQRPFSFNHFNPKSKKWAVTHNNTPGIDKWQKNTELAQHLATFSIGDSGRCIKKLLLHWEKMPRSTSRAPDIGNVNSPTQLSSTKVLPSKEGSSVTAVVIPIAILITIVTIPSVIICIYKNAKRKSHPQGGEMCCKLRILDSSICGNRRGQQTPSAMGDPRPEESICMIEMPPLQGASPCCSSASSVI